MLLASQLHARRVLIVTYEISSLYMVSPVYRQNTTHPSKDTLWLSPAIFSDGAAAVVLCRDEKADGCAVYSRDSLSFGDGPGFEDRLVDYTGGGGLHPPGMPGSEELACYSMRGESVKRYYTQGMMLNHQDLVRHRPEYLHEAKRIYIHQASPRLVEGFIDEFSSRHGVDKEKFGTNTRVYGNLVIPSTIKMLYDDLATSAVNRGDRVCFSVVGAGPERGAFSVGIA
jgi:3-oxoacyl-[acyl-carrier-protein] synthase-3